MNRGAGPGNLNQNLPCCGAGRRGGGVLTLYLRVTLNLSRKSIYTLEGNTGIAPVKEQHLYRPDGPGQGVNQTNHRDQLASRNLSDPGALRGSPPQGQGDNYPGHGSHQQIAHSVGPGLHALQADLGGVDVLGCCPVAVHHAALGAQAQNSANRRGNI